MCRYMTVSIDAVDTAESFDGIDGRSRVPTQDPLSPDHMAAPLHTHATLNTLQHPHSAHSLTPLPRPLSPVLFHPRSTPFHPGSSPAPQP